MASDYRDDINALVTHLQPRSLLLVGAGGREILADYLAGCDACRIEVIDVGALPAALIDAPGKLEHFDFALVSGVLERLDRAAAGIVLGRLRDLYAGRLLVVVPMAPPSAGGRRDEQSGWEVADLLGYGMYRAGAYEVDGRPLHVYSFDLYDYKPTPDWLNSRFWAHPERFDKFWW